ncbi:HIT family hydrolase [Campylobacter curvus]|uniref:HIT family hydrolase n=1 Tax=Campylobacter curvus TaxID=200 RepID=UPI00146FD79A|nr:HIT family hydrolase [Campylobacter curvus]
MTENEAIESLVGELAGEQVNEAQGNQEANAAQDAGEQSAQTDTKESAGAKADEGSKFSPDAMAKAMVEAMKAAEAAKQAPNDASQGGQSAIPANVSPEQQQMLEQLGLSQMQAQINEIAAKQAEAQEQARRQAVFNQNITQFEKEFPTIKPEELGKFAEANGALDFLGENYNGWKLVAMAMINKAAPQSEPDAIVGNGGGKNEVSAFDRLKKGESVSDLEIGAELLKGL